jgi:hypothetical protein
VVVDPAFFSFDDVQLVVRVPIIVEEIVKNYVPLERVGRFYVTRRREENEPIDIGFWQGVLGKRVDYGYLLRNISRAPSEECAPDQSPACLRYFELIFNTDVPQPNHFEATVDVGSYAFDVAFVRSPGEKTYLIPIDRLWFWRLGETMGLTPHLRAVGNSLFSAKIVTRKKKSVSSHIASAGSSLY